MKKFTTQELLTLAAVMGASMPGKPPDRNFTYADSKSDKRRKVKNRTRNKMARKSRKRNRR